MCFLLANFIVACRDGGNGRAAPGPFGTSLFVPFAFNMDQAPALDGGGYLNSGDYLWEKDFEVFKHLDIMQSGFEEKKGGNPRVVASRELGANFAIRGAKDLSPAEKEKYAEVWNKMYKRPALLRLLNYNCPDLANPSLRKAEIIMLLINNDISMPTMHHWVSIRAVTINKRVQRI